jgi:hypothetical protein
MLKTMLCLCTPIYLYFLTNITESFVAKGFRSSCSTTSGSACLPALPTYYLMKACCGSFVFKATPSRLPLCS